MFGELTVYAVSEGENDVLAGLAFTKWNKVLCERLGIPPDDQGEYGKVVSDKYSGSMAIKYEVPGSEDFVVATPQIVVSRPPIQTNPALASAGIYSATEYKFYLDKYQRANQISIAFEDKIKNQWEHIARMSIDELIADAKRKEQAKHDAQSQQWLAQGLCRYCGGAKGVFGKCKACGKKN
jgi:hypothetical protein